MPVSGPEVASTFLGYDFGMPSQAKAPEAAYVVDNLQISPEQEWGVVGVGRSMSNHV